MAKGIDYAFGNGLTIAQLKAAGVTFVCRYLSYLPNGKVISKAEMDGLLAAGVAVVLNWEFTGIEQSEAQGEADAREAQRQATALGHPGAPIIFSLDVAPGQAVDAAALAYMKGVAKVIPWGRRGVYGGYEFVKAFLDGNHGKYAWQTYAWSNGQWDARAQLRQVQNDIRVGPCTCDLDQAMAADFGQNPLPKPPAPKPPPPPPPAPVRYVADGTLSLLQVSTGIAKVHLSTLLRYTLEADKVFSAALSAYLQGADLTKPLPAGVSLRITKP